MKRISFLLFTLLMVALCLRLSWWQVERAQEKSQRQVMLERRSEQTYHHINSLPNDPRWYQLNVMGQFDQQHAILLDNQIHQGRVGYQVLLPFVSQQRLFLVNLGWLAAPRYREQLPPIPHYFLPIRLTGLIDIPQSLLQLGEQVDELEELIQEPNSLQQQVLRVQNLNLEQLAQKLQKPLEPWILQLDPNHQLALQQHSQAVVMGPQKHYAYALQWGLIAVAILLLSLWWQRRVKHGQTA